MTHPPAPLAEQVEYEPPQQFACVPLDAEPIGKAIFLVCVTATLTLAFAFYGAFYFGGNVARLALGMGAP